MGACLHASLGAFDVVVWEEDKRASVSWTVLDGRDGRRDEKVKKEDRGDGARC